MKRTPLRNAVKQTSLREIVLALVVVSMAPALAACVGTTPADNTTDDRARERAIAAEEQYLADRLGNATCLEEWGTEPTTGEVDATIANRAADVVSVEVTHPYWYSMGRDESDSISNAVYNVTSADIERVSGDDVSPC